MTDLLIGGAGLAGLRIGIAVLKADRTKRVIILEKEKHTGGRVATYYSDSSSPIGPFHWEMGSGRISTKHTKTLSLLKKYGLHTIPISSESDWMPDSTRSGGPNPFTELCAIYLDPLKALDPHLLATHTIEQLLKKTVGPTHARRVLALFPYHAETHTLRADLALRSFDEEMGHHSPKGMGHHSPKGMGRHDFVVCKEGLSALTSAMAAEFLERGGEIHHGITITGVNKKGHRMVVNVEHNHDTQKYKGMYEGAAVVLTMPCDVLKKITMPFVLPVLKHLAMEPLVRIYAIFPLQNGSPWFPQTKIVTDGPLRYIIPMNPKQGTIMISYMEGPDTDKWFHLPKEKLTKELMKEVRRLFPHLTIPEPTMVKRYPWAQGCSYWLPGDYDVEEESHASLQPYPRIPLFLAGESFAVKQCWMESALEQADRLVALPAFRL
jgi:monoamine oxidase